ncbi:MAG: hypothetical protein WBH47_09970 [Streptosporangiaceae bacterium]
MAPAVRRLSIGHVDPDQAAVRAVEVGDPGDHTGVVLLVVRVGVGTLALAHPVALGLGTPLAVGALGLDAVQRAVRAEGHGLHSRHS